MKKILFLFSIILFFNACCKKGVTTYITDPELKNITSIQTGTYYIYRDSITGVEDSVWVEHSISQIFPVNSELYGKNYNDKCEDHYEVHEIHLRKNNDNSFPYKSINIFKNSIQGFYTFISKPFETNLIKTTHYGYYRNEKFFLSFNLLTNNYDNVYHVSLKEAIPNSLQDSVETNTYFSTETGMIKYSIKTDTSYVVKELIRSHIVK
jgi:hypothetical protein